MLKALAGKGLEVADEGDEVAGPSGAWFDPLLRVTVVKIQVLVKPG